MLEAPPVEEVHPSQATRWGQAVHLAAVAEQDAAGLLGVPVELLGAPGELPGPQVELARAAQALPVPRVRR
jgi:hypothetical protein